MPDVKIGGEVPTTRPRQEARLFLSGWAFIQAVPPCVVTSQRQEQRPDPRGQEPRGEGGCYKNSLDLAEPLRAADVDCNNAPYRFSINLAITLQRLINADTLQNLATEDKYPDP